MKIKMRKKNINGTFFVYMFVMFSLLFAMLSNIFLAKPIVNASNWISMPNDTSFLSTGAGSGVSPYKISTAEQLATISRQISTYATKSFILIANINLSKNNWTPIGTETSPFKGTFDGDGHSIFGIKISSSDYVTRAGLFGTIYGAIIQNLSINKGLESYVVGKTNTSTTVYAGALAGFAYGNSQITNVSNNGVNIYSFSNTGDSYAGGLVGYSTSTNYYRVSNLGNVFAYNSLYSTVYSGGIVADAEGSTHEIRQAKNTGSVSANTNSQDAIIYAGGICAYSKVLIYNSFNTGSVFAGSDITLLQFETISYNRVLPNRSYSGGIVGYGLKNISNVYNTGAISSNAKTYRTGTTTRTLTSGVSYQPVDIDGVFYGVYAWKAYASSYYNRDITGNNEQTSGDTVQENVNAYSAGIAGYIIGTISNAYNDASIIGGKATTQTIYSQSLYISKKNMVGVEFEKEQNVYFAKIKYTNNIYYGEISGNKNSEAVIQNCYGAQNYFDFNRVIKVDSYDEDATLSAGTEVSKYLSGDQTVTPVINSMGDYFSNIKFHTEMTQVNSTLKHNIYLTYTLTYKTLQGLTYVNPQTMTIISRNELITTNQTYNYTIKSPSTLSASDFSNIWATNPQINNNRPYLIDFYW